MRQLALLIVTVALLATACSDGGSVFDLSVGDCFNSPETNEISRVEVIDCATPHDHEVYLLFELDGGDFPGSNALARESSDRCIGGFDEYVGVVYADSALDVGFLPPSEATWESGDREVICYLFDSNGAQLTAGAKGSGR